MYSYITADSTQGEMEARFPSRGGGRSESKLFIQGINLPPSSSHFCPAAVAMHCGTWQQAWAAAAAAAVAACLAARLTATQQQVHSPNDDMFTLYTVVQAVCVQTSPSENNQRLRNLNFISHPSTILINSSAGIMTLNGSQYLNTLPAAIKRDTPVGGQIWCSFFHIDFVRNRWMGKSIMCNQCKKPGDSRGQRNVKKKKTYSLYTIAISSESTVLAL